jgi:hypothetical protein
MTASEKISNSDLSVDAGVTKKGEVAELEHQLSSTPDSEAPHFDELRTKKLLRKLDWHLVPFLALLYLYVYNESGDC